MAIRGAYGPEQRDPQSSAPGAKIALFRFLFRGRDDVYPRRFENRKTGKAGYAPACANEWVRGVCEKPRIKCAACPSRRFLPVTDDVYDRAEASAVKALAGEIAIGGRLPIELPGYAKVGAGLDRAVVK